MRPGPGDRDYGRAIADYNTALRLTPNSAAALYLRGLVRQKTGDRAGAAADITAAKRIDPKIGS